MINKKLLLMVFTFFVVIGIVCGYKVDPPNEVVHQHIANEALQCAYKEKLGDECVVFRKGGCGFELG